mmetsp:Transcript_4935/g.10434  ORF Transcript_4935/g.10434 Transcript_4935/m.10434 type:complete len:1124 (-) Transcript_4935:3102-6473(-)|eukprot:CAMPEP_0178677032 /NCGR_PEP_ID=MMETSP0698-20121128/36231_1 /TAXON_ID=265572 /ORGANISM="Extubocellulus spinifer, Strain CCMP396" /LENGTH=1123 /DNA_ID=CAMNT_0020321307 /DNA_START=23 /DNA_END=3394 /DNA_ORIENTATION=+
MANNVNSYTEPTQEVEDEAEATLVAVLEERRDIEFDRGSFRSESQRDVLSAVPPEAAELLTAPAADERPGGNVGFPRRRERSDGPRPTGAHGAPPSHRGAGSTTSDIKTSTVTTQTSADATGRMNLLLAARDNMSHKNVNINVSADDGASSALGGGGGRAQGRGISRFSRLVMKVKEMNTDANSSNEGGSRASGSRKSGSRQGMGPPGGDSSYAGTGADSVVKTSGDEVNAPSPFLGTSTVPGHNRHASNTEQLFQNAELVENLFNIEEEDEEDNDGNDNDSRGDDDADGIAPPPPPPSGMTPDSMGDGSIQYQNYHDEESPLVSHTGTPSGLSSQQKRSGAIADCLSCLIPSRSSRKQTYFPVMDVLNPKIVLGHTIRFLRTTFLFAMFPCFLIATILFYYCGNPELPFLPNGASLSWWFLFILRQLVTLQLAWATEYVLVEAVACRSPFAIKFLGPLVTLFAMQAKGWPFIISSWAAWDLILLHGENAFAQHWLYFLDIPMMSAANGDGGFLESEIYLRSLLSCIFAGTMAAIKRTYLALYMGRRTFEHYRPQLEQLMVNIVLVAHIADLAAETVTPEFAEALAMTEESAVPLSKRGRERTKGDKKWADIAFEQDKKSPDVADSASSDDNDEPQDGDGFFADDGDGKKKMSWNKMLEGQSVASDDAPGLGQVNRRDFSNSAEDDGGISPSPPMRTISAKHIGDGPQLSYPAYQRQSSHSIKMKNLLDRWEEPANKLDKAVAPSIHDILQFRKALSYLDDTHPFSESFGPSETRDQCIKSSCKVFKRLLNFVPGDSVLPFDVIGSIAMDEDGIYDREVSLALVRLFRPDKNDCLTELAFVQSCDWLYKKVRYLRASVANSTLIDRVLEHDFNIIFFVFLALVVMSILDFDPWSLLLSMSALLVSFAFAVGPSAAKFLEGFFLIAMQRPYDLGDRICVTSAQLAGEPDVGENWFVEDVNLFTTTLRYAPTNTISTINNGSIANSRIINFARSRRAMVNLTLLFRTNASAKQIHLFRTALERYVKDNPRVWSSVVVFVIANIDPDTEVAEYKLRVQHQKSWQDMASVLINKGELLQFCITLMTKLGVAYDSPKSRVSVELTTRRGAETDHDAYALPSLHIPPQP